MDMVSRLLIPRGTMRQLRPRSRAASFNVLGPLPIFGPLLVEDDVHGDIGSLDPCEVALEPFADPAKLG